MQTLASQVSILIACAVVSFGGGRLFRGEVSLLLRVPPSPFSEHRVEKVLNRHDYIMNQKLTIDMAGIRQTDTASKATGVGPALTLPGIPSEFKVPRNKYTFQQFGGVNTNRRNQSVLQLHFDCEANGTCDSPQPPVIDEAEAHDDDDDDDDDNNNAEDDSAWHEPAGKHLLVDIEHVDADFLNDEERLATAMIELIKSSSMSLLSYHCYRLDPMGVSCIGVLLESHVSFHTWPTEGVITLDLFTCGPIDILPLLPTIKQLFAIPAHFSLLPRMVWRHKRRGFRSLEDDKGPLEDSRFHSFLGCRECGDKTHVMTATTDFQTIDIYDVVTANQFDKSEERLVFLNGILRSRKYSEAAYHEALVHPAMFTHEEPKRVVIVGGAEGATLREVLKHKTVKEVSMVEIDKQLVDTSREYLLDWSDCSNLIGSTSSCFDDPRVVVHFEDARAWFIGRFGSKATYTDADLVDVVVIDALDPPSAAESSGFLYDNDDLLQSVSNALGSEGILVSQVVEMDFAAQYPESSNAKEHSSAFLQGDLGAVGFEKIMDYEEACSRLHEEAWSYQIAMKSSKFRSNWLMDEAEMQHEISSRTLNTQNSAPPFHFFDGATMMQYQFPSRLVEESWCEDCQNECTSGHGFNPEIPDAPLSSFEVQLSAVAGGGRGLFAKEFIPKGSYIALGDCVHGMFVPSKAYEVVESAVESYNDFDLEHWATLYFGYIQGYGWTTDSFTGMPSAGVDSGILTFVNHGCNGTYNIGIPLSVNVTEVTARMGQMPFGVYGVDNFVYDPEVERHFSQCGFDVALRDIHAGEEILTNYLAFDFGEDLANWDESLEEVKELCSGVAGSVTLYELGED